MYRYQYGQKNNIMNILIHMMWLLCQVNRAPILTYMI